MMVFLDRPTNTILPTLAQFSGWIQCLTADQEQLSFRLNSTQISNVKIHERADVPAQHGMSVTGWTFLCETESISRNSHGTVVFTIQSGGKEVFRRYFRTKTVAQSPLLFFMHVPKTAGTSLRSAVEAVYPPAEILQIYDDPAHYSIGDLSMLSKKAFDDLSVVYGHFGFGLHTYTSRRFEYISFLRPPLHFVWSYIVFMKHVIKHRFFVDRDIAEIARCAKVIELDNCYTRFFSGRLDEAPIGKHDLECAIRNIKNHFAFVGSVERMEASVDFISEYLGREIKIGNLNTTPSNQEVIRRNSAAFEDAAANCVQFDLPLYKFVMEHFH